MPASLPIAPEDWTGLSVLSSGVLNRREKIIFSKILAGENLGNIIVTFMPDAGEALRREGLAKNGAVGMVGWDCHARCRHTPPAFTPSPSPLTPTIVTTTEVGKNNHSVSLHKNFATV